MGSTVELDRGSDLGRRSRVIPDADVRLHRRWCTSRWSVLATARGKEHGLRAKTFEELGDDRRPPWSGDDDQKRVRGRRITVQHTQPGPLQLTRRVASRPIKYPCLWPKAGPVSRGQRGAQVSARKRPHDMIGSWRHCRAGTHLRFPISSSNTRHPGTPWDAHGNRQRRVRAVRRPLTGIHESIGGTAKVPHARSFCHAHMPPSSPAQARGRPPQAWAGRGRSRVPARAWRRSPTTAAQAAKPGSNLPNLPNLPNFWGLRHSTDDACSPNTSHSQHAASTRSYASVGRPRVALLTRRPTVLAGAGVGRVGERRCSVSPALPANWSSHSGELCATLTLRKVGSSPLLVM